MQYPRSSKHTYINLPPHTQKLPLKSMHNEESAAVRRESTSFGPEGDVPRTLRQKINLRELEAWDAGPEITKGVSHLNYLWESS